MKKWIACSAVLASLAFVGCGPPPHDRALDIVSDPPSGQMDGAPWTMMDSRIRVSGDSLEVRLYGVAVGDCASSQPSAASGGYIMFSMPATVGKRELQLSFDFSDPDNQTITFYDFGDSTNHIAVDGILNLSALDSTNVTLGLLAKGGTGYEVNGTITRALCP
jgi:hypothetical protein